MASRFKVKRRDGLLLAVFYAAVGVIQLATLTLDVRMAWIGAIAILSLIASYGLLTIKKWAVWLVIGLFFPQAAFGTWTLYGLTSTYSSSSDLTLLLIEASLAVFIVLSLVSFIYVAARLRK